MPLLGAGRERLRSHGRRGLTSTTATSRAEKSSQNCSRLSTDIPGTATIGRISCGWRSTRRRSCGTPRRSTTSATSLHRIFRAHYRPTSVHRFLASVPERTGTHMLALTTNYDDALEQAFEAAGEPYSVVFYRASREGRCWLRHGEESEAELIAGPSATRTSRCTSGP